MSEFKTGEGRWAREVRDADGRGVAWCGQSDGEAWATRIAAALNSEAEVRDLKARLKAARSTAYAHEGIYRDTATALLDRATDLRRKNWRKP